MINFLKKNLTHKILPLLGLFLLIFYIIFNNSVFAYTIKYENGSINNIPDFPKGNNPSLIMYHVLSNGWMVASISYEEGSYFKIVGRNSSGDYLYNCFNSNGQKINFKVYGNYVGRTSWADIMENMSSNNLSNYAFNRSDFFCNKNIYNSDGSIFYASHLQMPTLEWSFDRRVNTIIMSSQYFDLDTISKYNLYYNTDNSNLDYKTWDTVPIGSFKDVETGNTSVFWFLSFENYYKSEEDFYFILEDINTGQVLASSMKVKFKDLNKYFDDKLNQDLINNRYIWRVFFKWCSYFKYEI